MEESSLAIIRFGICLLSDFCDGWPCLQVIIGVQIQQILKFGENYTLVKFSKDSIEHLLLYFELSISLLFSKHFSAYF